MLQGPAVELYEKMMSEVDGLHLIASGGVGCADDLKRLSEACIPGVIVGKAIYEKRVTREDIMAYV